MSKTGFSFKQLTALQESDARMNFWMGAVRSGKTFASIMKLIDLIQNAPPGDGMICGVSRGTIQRNIIKDLYNMLGWGMITENRTTITMYQRQIHLIGAKDERAVSVIQGSTLSFAYVDELPKLPRPFFKMLQSRCSVKGAQILATGNPEGPKHWVKAEYIDSPDIDLKHFKFVLEDNPSLDEKFKQDIRKEYTGVWYKRFILGEWAAAEGLIYDSFDDDNMYEGNHHTPSYYIAGIDYGTSNATCCLLAAVYPNSFPKIRIVKEYYYDSRLTGRCKTDSELAIEVYEMLKTYSNLRSVYVDPSALSFRTELERKNLPVVEADNDVINGIKVVSGMVYNKQICVNRICKNLIDSIYSYIWDEKASEKGEDSPKKDNDHGCVTADTLVMLSDGSNVPICELPKSGSIYNLNMNSSILEIDNYVNPTLTRKNAEIFELELEDGKTLRGTGDHKIMTQRGLVCLCELMLCDTIWVCNTNFITDESFIKTSPQDIG